MTQKRLQIIKYIKTAKVLTARQRCTALDRLYEVNGREMFSNELCVQVKKMVMQLQKKGNVEKMSRTSSWQYSSVKNKHQMAHIQHNTIDYRVFVIIEMAIPQECPKMFFNKDKIDKKSPSIYIFLFQKAEIKFKFSLLKETHFCDNFVKLLTYDFQQIVTVSRNKLNIFMHCYYLQQVLYDEDWAKFRKISQGKSNGRPVLARLFDISVKKLQEYSTWRHLKKKK